MNPRLPYVPTTESQAGLWLMCAIVFVLGTGGYVLAAMVGAAIGAVM